MQIKSTKNWQKHIPGKARRRPARNYYSQLAGKQQLKIKRIILIIVIILVGQAIFQTKALQLNNFVLQTNQDLSLDDIRPTIEANLSQNRYLIFKNSNYFLFKVDNLQQELVKLYNLDEVSVNKKFPHTLEVTLKEKVSQFIWQRDGTLYLLSALGALNRQISALDENYLVIEDQRSVEPMGEQILSDRELEIINQVYLAWQEVLGGNPKLVRVILTDDLSNLKLQTKIGYYVIVGLDKDINEQLNNLSKVLAGDIIGLDIDYIDLRFRDRVFFK